MDADEMHLLKNRMHTDEDTLDFCKNKKNISERPAPVLIVD
jgi:hypothetical protein